jgi:PIN domain nuclease of toxin-antitoxin system
MILLDKHTWIWWVQGDPKLPLASRRYLQTHESSGLGVGVISCWEVAKAVELGRLSFQQPVNAWINQALAYPGIRLIPLTPQITVESTELPVPFHRDPADRFIVATARIHGYPLVTEDTKIRQYPHVQIAP